MTSRAKGRSVLASYVTWFFIINHIQVNGFEDFLVSQVLLGFYHKQNDTRKLSWNVTIVNRYVTNVIVVFRVVFFNY